MKDVLRKTTEEAKASISKVCVIYKMLTWFWYVMWYLLYFPFFLKKQVQANVCLTMDMVKEALDQLRGAVMIVYPMGLPPHDPIRMEFENQEDLTGTQVLWNFCLPWITTNAMLVVRNKNVINNVIINIKADSMQHFCLAGVFTGDPRWRGSAVVGI